MLCSSVVWKLKHVTHTMCWSQTRWGQFQCSNCPYGLMCYKYDHLWQMPCGWPGILSWSDIESVCISPGLWPLLTGSGTTGPAHTPGFMEAMVWKPPKLLQDAETSSCTLVLNTLKADNKVWYGLRSETMLNNINHRKSTNHCNIVWNTAKQPWWMDKSCDLWGCVYIIICVFHTDGHVFALFLGDSHHFVV